ncbi:hypothetical protein FPCIR_12773 [Fusarium pseudocircinatum]|uniref:Uncharacterized protein n=1 Tax=Fusarium pseudocircinatum TaxID=56676 RepID=A0A8H5NS76_9HYPO|nr:hypothetical protein FPCIR_12773 [Fusarium pseudocircinatum]
MKAGNFFLSALSLAASLYTTKAADCGGYGVGSDSIGACTDRSGNYKDREVFCTTLVGQGNWKRTCQNGRNSGKCHFEYQGPGMPQQMCWDAYENIINQCFNHQNGGGYHYGTWSLDGHWFAIDRYIFCSAILLYLSGTSLAQNAASLSNCPAELRQVGEGRQIYNSTRTLSYKFEGQSKPWYITAAVTDVRPPFVGGVGNRIDSSQELSVFASVPRGYGASPDGRDIRICSHMMIGVRKSSENPTDAEYSCRGVISDKCIREYENANMPVPAPDQRCLEFSSFSSNLSDECSRQGFAGTANYTTFGTGWAGLDGEGDVDDFDLYDERVQRTIPVLMSVANGNDSIETKLLCIAPDQVVPGSRKPESKLGDEEEDENTASRVRGLGAISLGVGIVMLFSLLPSDFTDNVDKVAIFFNASGTMPIEFKGSKDPFYISTAVTDERDQNRTFDGAHSRQWIKGFISVPRYLVAEKSVGICSYMFQGLNSSSENPDDAAESCKGVISDACIEEFENSTLPIRTSGGCPSSAAFILSDECKKHLTLYQTVQPRNISTDNCTLGNIPNLDVPVDYWTYGGSISSGETGSDEYDDFDSYDMRVQQTVPIFTVVSGGGISDRKLVCITPDTVVSGSRKPELKLGGTEENEDEENEEGDENTGSRVGGLGAVFLSTVVMIFTLL